MKDNCFASLGRRDAESTLDSTLFRMYESRLYRWLTPDPLAGSIFNPQSLNRYAYVLNNPTNFIDPLGLDCNVFNGSWEGSGSPFPCWQQASWHYPSPAESPTWIAGPVGVAVGSMIGTTGPDLAEAEEKWNETMAQQFMTLCASSGNCQSGTAGGTLTIGGVQFVWVPTTFTQSGDVISMTIGHWEITGRTSIDLAVTPLFPPGMNGLMQYLSQAARGGIPRPTPPTPFIEGVGTPMRNVGPTDLADKEWEAVLRGTARYLSVLQQYLNMIARGSMTISVPLVIVDPRTMVPYAYGRKVVDPRM